MSHSQLLSDSIPLRPSLDPRSSITARYTCAVKPWTSSVEDRGELVLVSPDGVDGEHRTGWSQVDELDAARKLLDQRADDEAEAAAFAM